ncbi:MAG: NAD-glutamate dehydrogenase [Gammaproteobacteria bacterium]|nr:MAG: NAD-glutamate dehydrogenase [Gammaproteobacteria bacterium]
MPAAHPSEASSVLIDKVIELIRQKLKKNAAKLVEQFARDFLQSVSPEDLQGRMPSDVYASLMSLWSFLQAKGKNGCKLRVFNPDFEEDGWQSKHTVIEVLHDDLPFLVDSVRMELNRLGLTTFLIIHLPMAITRDKQGKVTSIRKATIDDDPNILETPMYIEVNRQPGGARLSEIEGHLEKILADVRLVVSDWQPMKAKMESAIADLTKAKAPIDDGDRKESLEFLKWLCNNHFTLIGYSGYDIKPQEGGFILQPKAGEALGLVKKAQRRPLKLSELPLGAQKLALEPTLPLVITKTSRRSTVHRPAYVDYIGVKRYDNHGEVVGEYRFLGLYTSEAYNMSPRHIPVLRRKLEWVTQNSGLPPRGHDCKALQNILETYPRDELFQMSREELLETALGILHMKERPIIKAFIRRDPYGRFFSVLVYVPRDQYTTRLRKQIMEILRYRLQSDKEITFETRFSESIHARTHYIVYVDNAESVQYDVKDIENEIREVARSWEDNFTDALKTEFGEEKGLALAHKYRDAFTAGYKADATPQTAVLDVRHMEELTEEHPLSMILYRPQENEEGALRFKLYHRDAPASLSEVLPMLENMGLNVIGETPYRVQAQDGVQRWILDFEMLPINAADFNLHEIKAKFQEAFYRVWIGDAENDGFNRLVLGAGLDWRQVVVLRAIAKYLWQIGFTFSQSYVEQTLAAHPTIARMLVRLFELRFEPTSKVVKRDLDRAVESIRQALTTVSNLDEDRIINRYIEVIMAMVRTNYYQTDGDGNPKNYVSFKLEPSRITEIPKPVPMFEIFVYSPRFEGVHLRGGKVARGGLRWSDRREDFRTEILGLVKAQQVKNSVIVPVGSKGGFVCKKLPAPGDRDAFLREGQECYRGFIRGLLDITDNLVNDKVVPPKNVVRHDEDDPYLVVAADKGTATFSDIANSISEEYNFWLGDAFASGGSQGYDHKKMGITARGAWESVKRHFREIGIDCQNEPFTCVGVGDMSGDVFGNGMLCSRKIKLIGAFNHMHIFIDPNPDPEVSYQERERLFNLPRSTWADYDPKLISEGGGVFERSAKQIRLTPQMKKMLGVKENTLTPNELIRALLKAEYDLFWNGGIGTYVKASTETNAEVGDRANDPVRINGRELRCKIVGEGGNLGFTQRGRIEYMMHGGRGNTDFTDNVGGVDCSDHEVNIKILLNKVVADGDLTMKQRNKLLADMTDDVAQAVLFDCYLQTQSISIMESRRHKNVKELMRFMHHLERQGKLDRALEFLPTDEELVERMANKKGFTRAELCVLLAYGKMMLKEELNQPEITETPYFEGILSRYFPKKLRTKFAKQIRAHRLRGPIIATVLANDLVNYMGCNFAYRMHDETGASYTDIAICFSLAREIFGMDALWREIEALDNKIPASLQIYSLFQSQRMIRRATRWFLRHRRKDMSIQDTIDYYAKEVRELEKKIDQVVEKSEAEEIAKDVDELTAQGMPKPLAHRIAYLSTMFSALDIVDMTKQTGLPVSLVAEVYYKLGAQLQLHWFLDQITQQPVDNHWQAFARSAFREELDWQQRGLTLIVLETTNDRKTADERIGAWMTDNADLIARWVQMISDFRASSSHEFAKFSVALRELLILVQNCIRKARSMDEQHL